MTPNVIETLRERGLLEAATSRAAEEAAAKQLTVYAGFDPSSDSLQAGNLIAILGLSHFQRHGHKVIAVVGGATGLIGDPSGKSCEREGLSSEQVERNLAGITENLSRFLDFKHPTAPAKLVNNNDWMKRFTFVDFLREVGRHFRMGTMLGKESVRARLEGEGGMNFAEFSYQLLQSYDFLHLYDTENCTMQLGGSDQWGNITAGVDLVRKLRGREVYGVTFPLVCDSSGRKFGKSEGNAVYLDSRKTSCFSFYQFFVRTADADAARFLKMFTFLPLDEIAGLERELRDAPEKRAAQKRLAEELTRAVHGKAGLQAALRATDVLYGGSMEGINAADLLDAFADAPSVEMAAEKALNAPVVDVCVSAGLCSSRGEARRLVSGGGLYINNERVTDGAAVMTGRHIVEGRLFVLRSGKKTYLLVKTV